jgi:serine protease Do
MTRIQGEEDEWRDLGVTGRALTPMMALMRNLPDARGILVTGVRPGYPCEAAQPKLTDDDVVRAVDGKPTPDLAALRRVLAEEKGKKELVFDFLRKDESYVTVVKMETPKADEQGGELAHAWLGVRTQVVTSDIAKALSHEGTTGFRITEVYPYTEAAKAGLKPGDVIVALNGNALESSRPQDQEDLKHAIEDLTAGETAQLALLRGGRKIQVAVKLEPTPTSAEQVKTERQKEFEFTVRQLILLDRVEHHWGLTQQGVFVTETTPGGWANIAGLHTDDLIVAINGRDIKDVAGFKSVMQDVVAHRPKVIRIFVRRDYLTHFVFIEPDWARLNASS